MYNCPLERGGQSELVRKGNLEVNTWSLMRFFDFQVGSSASGIAEGILALIFEGEGEIEGCVGVMPDSHTYFWVLQSELSESRATQELSWVLGDQLTLVWVGPVHVSVNTLYVESQGISLVFILSPQHPLHDRAKSSLHVTVLLLLRILSQYILSTL